MNGMVISCICISRMDNFDQKKKKTVFVELKLYLKMPQNSEFNSKLHKTPFKFYVDMYQRIKHSCPEKSIIMYLLFHLHNATNRRVLNNVLH